jgi:hypothetical protein
VVAWLLRERATGLEWRFGDSDLVWEAGSYDYARFELHVLDEDVRGAPDGLPKLSPLRHDQPYSREDFRITDRVAVGDQ